MKDKCDELDHHPQWSLTSNHSKNTYTLKIVLTSHFAKNNITGKDYELGAFLSEEFNRLSKTSLIRKYSRFFQIASAALLIWLFVVGFKAINRKKYSRFGPNDFAFSRINNQSNKHYQTELHPVDLTKFKHKFESY